MTRAVIGIGIIWGMVLILVTASRVLVWQTDETLWQAAVSVTPTRPRPLINHGQALLQNGWPGAAAQRFRQAYQEADHRPRREEGQLLAETNLAYALVAMDRKTEATGHLVRVLVRRPMYGPAIHLVQRLPWEDPECHP